ncbi:F-box domain-containing protein [Mycena venus]|uniref:F-box domain-containing protein n=1 Tax=Mycena venus TaxID=2733690 RepID=A0A8H7CFF8_9AGAR|nr:F-box domain-containing protein [Mycena venus]
MEVEVCRKEVQIEINDPTYLIQSLRHPTTCQGSSSEAVVYDDPGSFDQQGRRVSLKSKGKRQRMYHWDAADLLRREFEHLIPLASFTSGSAMSSSARAADRIRIAEIEAETQKLESAIHALRSERDVLQTRLNSYKYPVSTSLPNEIISEIFVHFLPVYPLCPPSSGILSPTVLTHICRKWREIALASPLLWRALRFESMDDNAGEEQIRVLASWITRSGSCPLSIQMDDHIHMSNTSAAKILEVILPHRARWEHINLVLAPSHLLNIEGPIPQLRELGIRIPHQVAPLPFTLQIAPRLRVVTLWDFPCPSQFLPWSQLTSLTLVAKEPHECTSILAQTVNLVHCKLVISGSGHGLPDIRLAFLESLTLIHFLVEELPSTRYLTTFIVPALRRLQIPQKFLEHEPVQTFSSFISKSGCQLGEVRFKGPTSRRDKEMWRAEFPSIEFTFNGDLIDWYSDY